MIFPPELNEAAVLNQADKVKGLGSAEVCCDSVKVRAAPSNTRPLPITQRATEADPCIMPVLAFALRRGRTATDCNATMNKTVSRIEYRSAGRAVGGGGIAVNR